jgi:two-component system sensor histidine kinase QseC
MRSIRRHLILLLISSITLISFSAAIQGYRASMLRSAKLFDAELVSMASSFAIYTNNQQGHVIDTNDNIALQVWINQSLVLRSLNSIDTPIAEFQAGFSDQNFNGQRWRVYTHKYQQQWVMVSQPLSTRFDLAESMILAAMTPLIIAIPILAILIYFLVSKGLSPLRSLSKQLQQRHGNEITPILLDNPPAELKPVVTTLNSLLSRLKAAFEREQQFASNAAHELRTPLSVLKINLHNLKNECPEYSNSIEKLQGDTDRMINVVNQILLLSRTNPEFFDKNLQKVDPYSVAQKVIADLYPQIDCKDQHVALEGEPTELQSSEFLLYTLIQNLVTNATKYSPQGADILVTVHASSKAVKIIVEDSGPGINESNYSRVLERFYRSDKEAQLGGEGSGLGLAIVQQIIQLHRGNVSLDRSDLGGLSVTIILPDEQRTS